MKKKTIKTLGLTGAVIAAGAAMPTLSANAEEVVIPVPEQAQQAIPQVSQNDLNKAGEVYNQAQTNLDNHKAVITNKTEELQTLKKNNEENQVIINKIPELREKSRKHGDIVNNTQKKLDNLKQVEKPKAESKLDTYKTERDVKLNNLKTKVQELENAQNKVDSKEKEIKNLENSKPDSSTIEKDITNTQNVLDTKRNNKKDLDKKISDLNKTIQEKTQELQDYKPGVNTETKITIETGDWELESRPDPMEIIDFKGRKIETLPYNPNFKPDSKEVSKYFLQYLNELRVLNGLAPVSISDDMMRIADIRANELIEDFSHRSKSGADALRENISARYGAGDFYSNQEIAYDILLGWFSDYNNVSGHNYGHRSALLDSGNIGVGVAVDPDNNEHFAFVSDSRTEIGAYDELYDSVKPMEDGKVIYRINAYELKDAQGRYVEVTMDEYLANHKDKGHLLGREVRKWDDTLGEFVPVGKYYVYSPGNSVKFIDNITFKYVVETPGEDKTPELKGALEKLLSQEKELKVSQNKLSTEIKDLETKLADLEKGKTNIQNLINTHKNKLDAERRNLEDLKLELKEKSDSKDKSQADLDALDAQNKPLVEELNKINKEIEEMENKLRNVMNTFVIHRTEYFNALDLRDAQPKLLDAIELLEKELKDLENGLVDLETKRSKALEDYKKKQIDFLLSQEGLKPFVFDLPGLKEEKPKVDLEIPRFKVPEAPKGDNKPDAELPKGDTKPKTNLEIPRFKAPEAPKGDNKPEVKLETPKFKAQEAPKTGNAEGKTLPKTSASKGSTNSTLPAGLASILLAAGLLIRRKEK